MLSDGAAVMPARLSADRQLGRAPSRCGRQCREFASSLALWVPADDPKKRPAGADYLVIEDIDRSGRAAKVGRGAANRCIRTIL